MLTLPIKKKWFDMILSGEKKEEYREIKPYYDSRFYHIKVKPIIDKKEYSMYVESPKYIIFKNGYQKNAPKIECYIELVQGMGKPEWGAESNKEYYVLNILSVEEVK